MTYTLNAEFQTEFEKVNEIINSKNISEQEKEKYKKDLLKWFCNAQGANKNPNDIMPKGCEKYTNKYILAMILQKFFKSCSFRLFYIAMLCIVVLMVNIVDMDFINIINSKVNILYFVVANIFVFLSFFVRMVVKKDIIKNIIIDIFAFLGFLVAFILSLKNISLDVNVLQAFSLYFNVILLYLVYLSIRRKYDIDSDNVDISSLNIQLEKEKEYLQGINKNFYKKNIKLKNQGKRLITEEEYSKKILKGTVNADLTIVIIKALMYVFSYYLLSSITFSRQYYSNLDIIISIIFTFIFCYLIFRYIMFNPNSSINVQLGLFKKCHDGQMTIFEYYRKLTNQEDEINDDFDESSEEENGDIL